MKRQIRFEFRIDRYSMVENGIEIFDIRTNDLRFDTAAFYHKVYKGKQPVIELVANLDNDTNKRGEYIFNWLKEIIAEINSSFSETQSSIREETNITIEKIIPLFEFSACAGEGFFIDADIPHSDISDVTGMADYAVTISGDSMEPTITNGSTVYVKKLDALESNDIGLFIVDGNVMCKRYKKRGRGYILTPDNDKYQTLSSKDLRNCRILGKVIS